MIHHRTALVALALLVAPAAHAADPGTIVKHGKDAKFENVRDDLKTAIVARGLVIDHASYIHDMLERTKADIGATKPLYKDAESFSFCSATLSRKMMEADAHNIAFCPYSLVVYTTVAEPRKVYVAYRRPYSADGSATSKAALKTVDELLDGIAKEALGLK